MTPFQMTPFQWIACSALALLAGWELLRLRRGSSSFSQWAARTSAWLAALVAIADPGLVTRFANAIGIGRGADVVLYLFSLAFLGSLFAFYSRTARLQRQIAAVVEHLALAEARRDPLLAAPPPPANVSTAQPL